MQFGGQTPLKLAVPLEKRGVTLLGTTADAIDRAEDRERFDELLTQARPEAAAQRDRAQRRGGRRRSPSGIGFPVLVRPSYVLGGRAMMTCTRETSSSLRARSRSTPRARPARRRILIDQFLKNAIEVDVDCVADGKRAVIGGVMQHIEEAGVHSGDSTSVLPPHSLRPRSSPSIEEQTRSSRSSSASSG